VTIAFGALAMAARYLLIQPPELSHRCDLGDAPAWCSVRLAIIMSYAWYSLGYLALGASIAALVWRNRPVATFTLCSGAAAIVLYCYEPGALALVVGALVLARSVSPREPGPLATPQHARSE
jgi:hypothetical protein